MKTKITAILTALTVLTACNDRPYAKVDHVTIQEIESSSVNAEPGVELWVIMILEGSWEDRCRYNLGGEMSHDGRFVCVVPAS
jgi:hypothetical protein